MVDADVLTAGRVYETLKCLTEEELRWYAVAKTIYPIAKEHGLGSKDLATDGERELMGEALKKVGLRIREMKGEI